VVTLLAAISLILSALVAARLLILEAKLKNLQQFPALPKNEAPSLPETDRPLAGLNVYLTISQDHPQPLFQNLLKEAFTNEDVADLDAGEDAANLKIKGTIVCNGYADVYYSAELECSTKLGPLFTIGDKPAQGDRPVNLAMQLVDRLKRDLPTQSSRLERQRAIRELR